MSLIEELKSWKKLFSCKVYMWWYVCFSISDNNDNKIIFGFDIFYLESMEFFSKSVFCWEFLYYFLGMFFWGLSFIGVVCCYEGW